MLHSKHSYSNEPISNMIGFNEILFVINREVSKQYTMRTYKLQATARNMKNVQDKQKNDISDNFVEIAKPLTFSTEVIVEIINGELSRSLLAPEVIDFNLLLKAFLICSKQFIRM